MRYAESANENTELEVRQSFGEYMKGAAGSEMNLDPWRVQPRRGKRFAPKAEAQPAPWQLQRSHEQRRGQRYGSSSPRRQGMKEIS